MPRLQTGTGRGTSPQGADNPADGQTVTPADGKYTPTEAGGHGCPDEDAQEARERAETAPAAREVAPGYWITLYDGSGRRYGEPELAATLFDAEQKIQTVFGLSEKIRMAMIWTNVDPATGGAWPWTRIATIHAPLLPVPPPARPSCTDEEWGQWLEEISPRNGWGS